MIGDARVESNEASLNQDGEHSNASVKNAARSEPNGTLAKFLIN